MAGPKRIILFFCFGLCCFLGLYAWDVRTGRLTRLASLSGLEIVGQVLYPGVWLRDRAVQFVDNYLALSSVSVENARLTEELGALRRKLLDAGEDQLELFRLRGLMNLPDVPPWEKTGARVIAGRFGPQAMLTSVILNKGFLGGALPGAPVVTPQGVVGRVLHTAPHSSTVLLITDPSFRVAVVGQESRARGILFGSGEGNPLLVQYVDPQTNMRPGELLICSGLDGIMPKGVPAARINVARYDKNALFPHIAATPLADFSRLEEVLVLIPPRGTKPDELLYEPFGSVDVLPDFAGALEQEMDDGAADGGVR
ncbi:MAG: rod shape-determining protein MreC [Deltaproteobacteria bacterium]|nr:rod shape-determining protein MreC [Deltaproteobacteria bacterium]